MRVIKPMATLYSRHPEARMQGF